MFLGTLLVLLTFSESFPSRSEEARLLNSQTSLAKWLLEFLGIPRKILGIPRKILGIPRNKGVNFHGKFGLGIPRNS